MSYLGDPRENAICEESGVTWESDNRKEQMWHWGAQILDLCDLPVEEYMKNPIVEAVNGSGGSGGGSGDGGDSSSMQEVVDAINSAKDEIVEAINSANTNVVDTVNSAATGIVDSIDSAATVISETVQSTLTMEIKFYYASVNAGSEVSSGDYIESYALVGSDANITFKLGNPSQSDWEAFKNGTLSETELRQRSANSFYLAVPSEYDGKFILQENGSIDVTDKFTRNDTSEFDGYVTYKSVDSGYFNDDYSDFNQSVCGVGYKITFTK